MKRERNVLSLIFLAVILISINFPSFAKNPITGPFDSMRDYLSALEESGRVLTIKEVDQDNYEATAFVYKMLDKLGIEYVPALKFEKIKIEGRWMNGPVYANIYPGWDISEKKWEGILEKLEEINISHCFDGITLWERDNTIIELSLVGR